MKTRLFHGSGNPELAREFSSYSGISIARHVVGRFQDEEVFVSIDDEDLKGVTDSRAIVLQSTQPPAEHFFEFEYLADILKHNKFKEVIGVISYFGYGRQEKRHDSGLPNAAKMRAKMLSISGVDKIITVNFHKDVIRNFFTVPVYNLNASPLLLSQFLSEMDVGQVDLEKEICIVAPDAGSYGDSFNISQRLQTSFAFCKKIRPSFNKSRIIDIGGSSVVDKICYINDELTDTFGTTLNVANLLIKMGAREVYAGIVHSLFSGDGYELLNDSPIKRLYTTNTLPLKKIIKKMQIISVVPLLATAIKKLLNNELVDTCLLVEP